MPSLAICIPAYNRTDYLRELLESIVAQGNPDLEIIVSDDCSPDDPSEMIATFVGRIPKLRYIRQAENIGLDRNFLAVVDAATSDYIWLMGDDDRLEPEGARRVFDALDHWPGVSGLTLGVIDYDFHMQKPTGVRLTPPTQVFDNAAAVFSTIGELLGFMSALVVDRKKWLSIANDPSVKAFENYYVQVYIIGRVIELYKSWGVVQPACVGFRTSNDQFLSKFGWFKRLKMDVVAYEQIADALFANNPAARRAMRTRIFDTHVMARLRNAKSQPGPTPQTFEALRLLFPHYKDLAGFWTNAVPTLLMPGFAIRLARKAYRKLAKSSGAARARQIQSQT